ELGKLRALWMHQAFDRVPPALLSEMLAAKDARVRAAAIRVLPEGGEIGPLEKLVADEHPRVRLAAVRALGSRSSARSAELALGVLAKPMDNFLDYAVWLTINELAEPWLAAVKNGSWKIEGRERQLEFALKAVEPAQASAVLGLLVGKQGGVPRDGSGPWIELIGSAGGAAELRLLFDQLLRNELNAESTSRAFAALGDAARLRSAKPSGDLGALTTLLGSANEKIRIAALQLGGAWKLRPLLPQIVAVTTKAGVSAAERTAAFAALRDIGGAGAIAELKKLAAGEDSPELRREATVTLASLELPTAMPYVIAVLKATTDDVQSQALWRSLLSIRGVSGRLTTELEKTELPREVARAGLRPAREGTQHQALVPVLLKSAGLSLSNVQLSAADMQQLAREALAKGDPKRGEMIYRRAELACMTCHAIGGAGGKLGPDMTSLGASAPPDYIVESLLYPNAKIKEGYHSASISTRDGRELSGMIAKESDTEIVLRTAANEDVSVATKDITRRTSVGSLMPAGLIDGLVPEERLDLIAFIAQLGKPGEFDAAKGGVARAWRLYLVLSSNEHLGVERVVRGDFTLADWKPVLSLTSGTLAKGLLEAQHPNRNNNRGWFAATRVEAAQEGSATFTLSNPGGVKSVWVNGTLVKAGAQFTAPVKKGANTLVLKLDDVAPQDVAVRSGDVTFSIE
ncbi:MAG TPA: HEAT repeat domain-containing protein, partial [Opitutaceae bacterium]